MTTTWYPGEQPEEFDDPLVDVGGYLACGCHGSQREHSCQDERTGVLVDDLEGI